MNWTRTEAEAAASERVWEADLRCRGCKDEFVGEVVDGKPAQGCPSCQAPPEEIERA